MALVPFVSLAQYGIVTDVAAHLLPKEAWSAGKNIRIGDNKVQKFTGHASVFGTPTYAPYWLMAVPTTTSYFWMYAGYNGTTHKMFCTDMARHFDISRVANYTASARYTWTGGILGSIPVVNNGTDVPQMWSPVTSGTILANLTNW